MHARRRSILAAFAAAVVLFTGFVVFTASANATVTATNCSRVYIPIPGIADGDQVDVSGGGGNPPMGGTVSTTASGGAVTVLWSALGVNTATKETFLYGAKVTSGSLAGTQTAINAFNAFQAGCEAVTTTTQASTTTSSTEASTTTTVIDTTSTSTTQPEVTTTTTAPPTTSTTQAPVITTTTMGTPNTIEPPDLGSTTTTAAPTTTTTASAPVTVPGPQVLGSDLVVAAPAPAPAVPVNPAFTG